MQNKDPVQKKKNFFLKEYWKESFVGGGGKGGE